MARRHRPYPEDFKQTIVELVRCGGSPRELGREFGCSPQEIRGWARRANRDAGELEAGLSWEEQEERRRSRRKFEELRSEREIVRKATAWFASQTSLVPENSCAR